MSLGDRADAAAGSVTRADRHESFLVYARFRFLKIAMAAMAAAVLLYAADKPDGGRFGGTWAGWTLGIVAALLIVWLTWFGYRKRSYRKPEANLVAWLSAHVYLGLALLVIATLHTGFYFGWNIHTLAYVLMCLVIASGAFGVFCYVRYPRRMTENRRELTLRQMLGRIASFDEELHKAALGVADQPAAVIRDAIEKTVVGGSLRQQLLGHYPGCATAVALTYFGRADIAASVAQAAEIRKIRMLLEEKALLLARARRDISFKAMLEVWLYIHVPLTFALLAALLAHIVAVLYLW
ncbi:MAG TPA: hypothetical protein VM755_17240 [Stellaceae bacterium]|nr:hypothetical protein [Stellaceae bacterium]